MNRILEQVQSGDFDPRKMFTGNKDKFLEVKTAIENISNNLTKETCIEFLQTKILPTAFDKTVSDAARDQVVEIGFHLLKFVNISILHTKDQEIIFTSIEETYAKTVGELRDNNYPNWDKLWIFLIRLCHDKIHGKMSLANKLLRVVEVAFRNSTSIDQRLKAYDCWKELIDNSSLNMEHMCSVKQIKLLVTPLKAKFSRTPIVINKRCDIFVYLLEKLQDKAFLCLKEFLEFSFGPFEEKNDVEKMRQGKSVPKVCIKSTKVLTQILGHSHDDTETCVRSDDMELFKSIINFENFPNYTDILLNSVVECCILLNEWNTDFSQSNTIIKCLWRSLLIFVENCRGETRRKCCTQLNNSLRKLTERCEFNKHVHTILGNVFGLLLTSDLTDELKDVLFDIAMNLLSHQSIDLCVFDEEEVLQYIESCFETENSPKFSKIASTYFRNDTEYPSSDILCEVWLKCSFFINSSNISNLIWPIRHLKNFKDITIMNSKWISLYTTECKYESLKVLVLQEMEKLFMENPRLSSGVIHFLELISTVEVNVSKDFVTRFMRVIELALTLPNISETDLGKLSSIVLGYTDQKKTFYKAESVEETLDKVCGCLEHLITIHKEYNILPQLYTHLKEGQEKILTKLSKRLMPTLEALMLNEDDAILNVTRKLMELLETKDSQPESIPLVSTRSLRIINMTNTGPKLKQNLKMLGKNSEVSLTLKTNKSTTRSPRKSEEGHDKSSDYVKIATQVKLDFKKQNEHHQKVFKRRDSSSQQSDVQTGERSKENLVAVDSEVIRGPATVVDEVVVKKRKRSTLDEDGGSCKKVKLDSDQLSSEIDDTLSKSVGEKDKILDSTISQLVENKSEEKLVKDSGGIENPVVEQTARTKRIYRRKPKTEEQEVRKSARQVKRRDISFIVTPRKNSKTSTKKDLIETPTTLPESDNITLDDGSTIVDTKKEEEITDESLLRKSKRQQNKSTKSPEIADIIAEKPGENDSLNTLVDKKMEENRKLSFDGHNEKPPRKRRSATKNRNSVEGLEDGNQNKILMDDQEEANRSKQEKIRQIVSKVKKQVMRTVTSDAEKTLDVYEFTGDDYPADELKKSVKKAKKKRLTFGKDDYVRRKKVRRPFHVTADFTPSVPLSKSQSLRAVSSPQEGETITILITRSPLEVETTKDVVVDDDESPSRRRIKRKSPQIHSEDVIESSQPVEDVSTGKNKSPPNDKTRPQTRSSSSETKLDNVTPGTSTRSQRVRRFSLTDAVPEKVKSARRVTRTRSLEKFDLDTEVMLLTKTMSEEEEATKLPDTLTPSAKEDLPGSPVTCDTPDRTVEFLNNTLDISPINSVQEEEEEEDEEVPRFASKEVTNVRAAKLLQMVQPNVKWFGKRTSSPSTSKVRKMRLRKEENLDILTFSREVPSPLTVPVSGILKRKFGSLEETSMATPSPKRKRVNFSDPATTEKKIFIKDSEEYDSIDQSDDSTKEAHNSDLDKESALEDMFLETMNREDMLLTIKDFCDSKLKDFSVNTTKLKKALRCLIQNLNVPEIVEIVTEFLGNLDRNVMSQVSNALVESEAAKETFDRCILPLIENENVFDLLLPKLMDALERLPDRKLQHFLREVVKAFGENRLSHVVKEEMTHKQVEDHVISKFDCDKMKELIQRYLTMLEDQKRNEFLVDMMNLASRELPVNKEFVNWHVDVLQNFVKRMSD